MLGFEPGDEALAAVVLRDLAEAQERAHLVHVAPHRLRQPVEPLHERVGAVVHQLGGVAQP